MIMSEVYFAEDIDRILDKLDLSKLGKRVGIKVHFGEKNCDTYINPEIVRKVYNKVIESGREAVLIECNVLYRGERTTSTNHIKLAKEHGFDFAEIDILDREYGQEFIEVEVDGFGKVKLGKGLEKYDSLIVLSHFKGHIATGFGGAIKNLGMGLGSRAGKLHMHSNNLPFVMEERCVGCEVCIKNCNENAIQIINKKASIDNDKCVGCAMCIAVCPEGAIKNLWDTSSDELQKRIVNYCEGVFKLIPQSKIVFINVLKDITPECDCMSKKQEPMMKDVGILLSNDIVSIDKASLDLVNKKSNNRFDKINTINKNIQIDFGEERGLGNKDYGLVT